MVVHEVPTLPYHRPRRQIRTTGTAREGDAPAEPEPKLKANPKPIPVRQEPHPPVPALAQDVPMDKSHELQEQRGTATLPRSLNPSWRQIQNRCRFGGSLTLPRQLSHRTCRWINLMSYRDSTGGRRSRGARTQTEAKFKTDSGSAGASPSRACSRTGRADRDIS